MRSPLQRKDLRAQPEKDVLELKKALVKVSEYLEAIPKMVDALVAERINKIDKIPGTMGPQGTQGTQGPRGFYVKGPKGDKGDKPVAGIDYPFPKDGKTPVAGIDFPIPKDGVSPVLDLDELIDKLKKSKRLTFKDIDGLEQTIRAFSHQLSSKGYLHGGGVPSLSAGSGITLTAKSDGGFTVSATGATIASETPVGAVDGSNVSFTVSNTPLFIIADSQFRVSGQGYTYVAPTVTMDALIPPVQFLRSYYAA